MDVVLNSHIALLVLGYLYEEKLDHVSKYFCKFSPYLDEEYQIIKKGLRPIIINSDNLSTIVREHCYIKSKVNEVISAFPRNIKIAFDRQTLSGKINHLLKIVKKTIGTTECENSLKRNRSEDFTPSENSSSINTTQVEDLPGYCAEKKRKIADSYMFIGNDFSEESESDTEDEASDDVSIVHKNKNKPKNKLMQNINKVLELNSNNKKKVEDKALKINQTENLNQLADEVINNTTSTNVENTKISKNQIRKNNRKDMHKSSEKTLNELNFEESSKIYSVPSESCSQFHIINEKPNMDCNANKNLSIISENEDNVVPNISESDINFSTSKILLMNSADFVSTNHQNVSSFKNDQILLDLNGVQTFPVLMGADGAMYINSNILQNDVRQLNNVRADTFNLIQKNFENIHIVNADSFIEELQDTSSNLNSNQTEILRETNNVSCNKYVTSPNKLNLSESKNNTTISSLEFNESKDKTTPEHNINFASIPLNKSLSTPRRKSSHVRVLNFSPLKSFRIFNNKITTCNKQENNDISTIATDDDRKLHATENLNPENPVPENESSSDLTEEKSNITVIQRPKASNNDTPKRKRDLLSCKRNLSRSNSEETIEKAGPKNVLKQTRNSKRIYTRTYNKMKSINESKENLNAKQTTITSETISLSPKEENMENSKTKDAMEEWKKLREKSKNQNFDQFLREIHSKTPLADAHITKRRKMRRKIGFSKLKKSSKGIKSPSNKSKKSTVEPIKSNILKNKAISDKKKSVPIEKEVKTRKKGAKEKVTKSIETKTNFLNFRIKTPIKTNSRDSKSTASKRVSKNTRSKSNKNKEVYDTGKQPICIETSVDGTDKPENQISTIVEHNFELDLQPAEKVNQKEENNQKDENCVSQTFFEERDKRTANIAHILDTPFKLDENNLVPTTPGFLLSNTLSINNTITPMTKLTFSAFCNSKNIDIKTPAFAITPGGHLCYSTDKETPKSGVITDYSSGGSYYRPDDAVDINKKLDRELNEKFDKKQSILKETEKKILPDSINICQNNTESDPLLDTGMPTTNDQSKPVDTIVTEIIPCPVVLEKVKSFSEEIPDVVPHYKFIEAGLPDITDESTTSSSSSSDESSSSSSSNSSPVQIPLTKNNFTKLKTEPLSLLSNIDSSEDEEWEIQSNSKNKTLIEENSQLVSNDGEVRFPVRSWITPKKKEKESPELNNKQNCQLSLESLVDIPANQEQILVHDQELNRKTELNEKLERVKAKLNQSKCESSDKSIDKKIKCIKIIDPPNIKPALSEKSPKKTKTSNNQSEVLAALNLSAKKHDATTEKIFKNNKPQETSEEKNVCAQIDDNATSELFTLRMLEESNDSLEVRNAALTLTKMKTKKINDVVSRPDKIITTATKKRIRKNENNGPDSKNKSKPLSNISKNKCELNKSNLEKQNKNLKINEKETVKKCSNKPIKKPEKEKNLSEEVKCDFSTKSQSLLEENANLRKDECDITVSVQSFHVESFNHSVDNKFDDYNKTVESNTDLENNKIKNLEVKNSSQNNLKLEKNNIFSDSGSESESECEDPYDECQAILADEISKNIKSITFDENNVKEINPPENFDFAKFTMKITINEQIRKIECTDEISLFHLKPIVEVNKSTKQNSNRRKTKSNKTKKEEMNNSEKILENKKTNVKKCEETNSSTQLSGKIKITHKNKFSNELELSKKRISFENVKNCNETEEKKSTSKQNYNSSSIKTSNQEKLTKQKIKNEDINAVLSHLYGNGK